MARIHIYPEGQDIQSLIDISETKDTLIFNHGVYPLKETLRFKSDRRYFSYEAVFIKAAPFDGPMIRMVGEPLPPQTFFQRIFWRINVWVRRIFRLPPPFRSLIHGFTLQGAGMDLRHAENCGVIGNTVIGANYGFSYDGSETP